MTIEDRLRQELNAEVDELNREIIAEYTTALEETIRENEKRILAMTLPEMPQ